MTMVKEFIYKNNIRYKYKYSHLNSSFEVCIVIKLLHLNEEIICLGINDSNNEDYFSITYLYKSYTSVVNIKQSKIEYIKHIDNIFDLGNIK